MSHTDVSVQRRSHQIVKLIAEYCVLELTSTVVPHVALKEVAHEMVWLSESHRGLDFCEVISV